MGISAHLRCRGNPGKSRSHNSNEWEFGCPRSLEKLTAQHFDIKDQNLLQDMGDIWLWKIEFM